MKLPLFLDTNIFLRALHETENHQMFLNSVACLDAIRHHHFDAYTSPTVLSEVAWTLKTFYHQPKTTIIQSIQSIACLNNLTIKDDTQISQALRYFAQHNIKFIDCLIASSKNLQAGKWQLVSYDTDFDKIPKLKRLEPQDIIL